MREQIPADRFDALVIAGDRDGVGEQVAAFLDAGLDGLIVNMPEVHDLQAVALAGETLQAAYTSSGA
jgi:alkanesulfonate monooxygenase SsuD/methylene tetrahydromethanopterin reductase-like flavin-dependent oxidoreductase (luciferase family)